MIAFIEGKVAELNPAFVILDTGGVGYHINISLYTYDKIRNLKSCKLFTHLAIREDAHTLYGFFDKAEKELFRLLLGVSGIGPSVSRMILSSMGPADIKKAIIRGDVALLKSVKGIGPKSAQRIIVELQDTLTKEEGDTTMDAIPAGNRKDIEEAREALLLLGFKRSEADKAVNKAIKISSGSTGVEELIKLALKNL